MRTSFCWRVGRGLGAAYSDGSGSVGEDSNNRGKFMMALPLLLSLLLVEAARETAGWERRDGKTRQDRTAESGRMGFGW